jgi:TolB-like protein/Tfp pilus assembly protein PilF
MSFFAELKRRNVFKVAVAYAVVAWLLIQVTAIVLPTFDTPRWVLQAVTFIIILGFPLAVFLAWAFELTPEGIKPTKEVDTSQSITHHTGQKLNYIIITLLLLAVVFLVIDNYVLTGDRNERAGVNKEQTLAAVVKAPGTTPVTEQSIAVLPFVNMSSDPEQEYFSDGISEEILNSLARIPNLQVRGRTSSFYFKGRKEDLRTISKMLKVENIIEGSVRKSGNQVRITVQLINARTDTHLWSKTYDRELKDIFAIQEDIAQSVADALSITLGVGELGSMQGMTRNMAAYEDYLTGRSLSRYSDRESYLRAIEHLGRAVSLDPDFGLAWGQLAYVYYYAAVLVLSDRADEYLEKSEQAAARAITLAPEAVSSLNAVASLQAFRHEWAAAEQTFKKALALAPTDYWLNYNYATFLTNVGHPQESIEYLQRANRTEPLAVDPVQATVYVYDILGDFDKALQEYKQAKQRKVGNLSLADSNLFVIAMGRHDRALMKTSLDKVIELDKTFLPPDNQSLNPTMRDLLDSPEQARETLHRFVKDPNYNNQFIRNVVIAVWASYFGDYELALNMQYQDGKPSVALTSSLWRQIHKGMRRLPGFKDLVRKLGLVDYWRMTGKWGEFCRPVGNDNFECS